MSIENTYDEGAEVAIRAAFRDESEALVDPSLVVARVRAPDGTVTLPVVSRDSAGLYHADVVADQYGTWYYRFEGSGTFQAAGESGFGVRRSRF